jgi:glutamine synthetase
MGNLDRMDFLRYALDFFDENPQIGFLNYYWVDMSGVLRVRISPKTHALKLANEMRPLKVGTWALMGLGDLSTMPFRPGSSSYLWPDWRSLRLVRPGHASVFCNVAEDPSAYIELGLNNPYQLCPRSVLLSILERARVEDNLSFKLGFELEFYLMSDADLKTAVEDSSPSYCHLSTASAMHDERAACVEACVSVLHDAGIEVEQFHAETGRHMYEISIVPLQALVGADTCNQAREIVKRTATKRGFHATFLPKPFLNSHSVGQHIHLSIHEEGDAMETENSRRQNWFLAGILHRLPLLCVFGMPSVQSYERYNLFALAPWVSWGTENKDAPIRKIKDGHWEFRTVDGTANVYLVVAAFIAAGILGIRQQQFLKWKDNQDFLERLDDEAKEKLGIDTMLPKSLEEALHLCKSDIMGLDSLLGEHILEYYTAMKTLEQSSLASVDKAERKRMYYELF